MYRTVQQLDVLTATLASSFPQVFTRQQLPETSVEGRAVHALRMRAGGGPDRRAVVLIGGTHARELMNPDAIVELAVDLVGSYRNGTGITYGGKTWSAEDIRVVLETLDVWLVPCVNPDGRQYVMTADDMWRKNRRDNPGTACDGVDLNRNLDILWGVAQGQTSCSACTDIYCGPAAISEPENRNVKHLLDTQRVVSFADVHSYSELILYPWGHAPTQSTDSTKRFTSLQSGTCTASIGAGYQEYMDPRDRQRFETVAKRIVDNVAAVRGQTYVREPSVALYPTTGTYSDYAYARHIADPALRKTYGFTFETGPWAGNARDSFHPADPEPVKRDAKAAMLTLLQQSVCAIELVGSRLLQSETEITALRKVRDELLTTTLSGRDWIALFERVQLVALTVVLADEKLATTAAKLLQRVGVLLRDDVSVITPEDTEQATGLIARLREQSRSTSVRKDLDAVARRIKQLAGGNTRQAIEGLMQRSPGN